VNGPGHIVQVLGGVIPINDHGATEEVFVVLSADPRPPIVDQDRLGRLPDPPTLGLRPGQQATVKITAYDFSIYGGLKATLEQISADSIKEDGPRGETFFRVTLRTDKNYLGDAAHPLPIMPGMTASAEILTGHKTVLAYLMKPILKARERALTER